MTNQEANIIIGACTILDVIKSEWGAAWSEWDQSVRDGLSKMLATIYSARESPKREWMGASAEPRTQGISAEQLAQRFHETYERLAPNFGYKTREASAKPWADVPKNNKRLMIAVCAKILPPKGEGAI
jgi:hypothetical protein